jgi:cation diffusion facilitator CzcD-associated flavoprotein CzcO
VDKYELRPHIKLQHRVTRAAYNEESGKWVLTGTNEGSSGSDSEPGAFEDTVDFLFPCLGVLSRWHWPDIEGLETFEGTLIHSADWKTGEGDPESGWETTVKSWGDKRIGVIGVVSHSSRSSR